jgi:hypothetical protein
MTSDAEPGRSTQSEDGAETTLPDEAVVVRGGLSTPETLHKSALAHFDEKGVFALSVRSRPPMSAEELARVDPPMLHPRMRATTVGVLRRAGYDVIPDEPPPAHALIMLPGVPADDDYVTVSAIFGEPTSNPAYQRGAR